MESNLNCYNSIEFEKNLSIPQKTPFDKPFFVNPLHT